MPAKLAHIFLPLYTYGICKTNDGQGFFFVCSGFFSKKRETF